MLYGVCSKMSKLKQECTLNGTSIFLKTVILEFNTFILLGVHWSKHMRNCSLDTVWSCIRPFSFNVFPVFKIYGWNKFLVYETKKRACISVWWVWKVLYLYKKKTATRNCWSKVSKLQIKRLQVPSWLTTAPSSSKLCKTDYNYLGKFCNIFLVYSDFITWPKQFKPW